MNFQLISVELHPDEFKKFDPAEQGLSEYCYTGIAIEDDGKYYYWAKGISVEIKGWEYHNIKLNSRLYYFSTALKLHQRIDSIKKLQNMRRINRIMSLALVRA